MLVFETLRFDKDFLLNPRALCVLCTFAIQMIPSRLEAGDW